MKKLLYDEHFIRFNNLNNEKSKFSKMVRLIKYHGSIIATTSVLILCISLALIKHPPLIGIWESTVVYRSFLPTTRPPLVLGIQKSANTTGHHGLFG